MNLFRLSFHHRGYFLNQWIKLLIPMLSYAGLLSAQSLELNLETVRKLALENNPQLKAAQKDIQKATTKVKESFGSLLPTVNTYANYQRAWELPTIYFDNPDPTGPKKISFKMGQTHTLASGLKIDQPLYLGGSAWNGYQLAQLGQDLSAQQLKITRTDVLLNATDAYLGLLFARSVIDVNKQAVETAEKNLQQVQNLEAVGKGSHFDVLRAEVQLASLQPQLISAQNNARLAESRLKMALNLSSNQTVEVTEKLTYKPSPLTAIGVETLVQQAFQQRPEMQILSTQKVMAQKQVSLSRASLMPKLVFSTTYQYQGEKETTNFKKDDFFNSFNSSISVSLPLFTGYQTQSRIQQAKIELQKTSDQADLVRQAIRLEVETALFTTREAEEKVKSQEKLVEQSQEALRLASLRFQEGSSTQLDVMNAELSLNQARMSYNQSLFEYNLALARLNKALNQL